MSKRIFLTLAAFNAALIFIVAGLHYGYHHHERTEEPATARAIEPWPAEMKAQMVDGCVQLTPADREQCECTFDWYEQNAPLAKYMEWSGLMAGGQKLDAEAQALFFEAGEQCASYRFSNPHQTLRYSWAVRLPA